MEGIFHHRLPQEISSSPLRQTQALPYSVRGAGAFGSEKVGATLQVKMPATAQAWL